MANERDIGELFAMCDSHSKQLEELNGDMKGEFAALRLLITGDLERPGLATRVTLLEVNSTRVEGLEKEARQTRWGAVVAGLGAFMGWAFHFWD